MPLSFIEAKEFAGILTRTQQIEKIERAIAAQKYFDECHFCDLVFARRLVKLSQRQPLDNYSKNHLTVALASIS